MITVTAKKSSGKYSGYTVTGHAGAKGKDETYDLVCAAVSAVTLTTAKGLQDFLKAEGTFDSEPGLMHIDISGSENDSTEAVIGTMLCGLEEIQRQYPKYLLVKYVKG